jgi:subtilisin family serine protease
MLLPSMILSVSVASIAAAEAAAGTVAAAGAAPADAARYLVQAANSRAANQDVRRVGGKVEQDLGIINAVAAELNPGQVARLRDTPDVHIFADRSVTTAQSSLTTTLSESLTGSSTPTDGTGVSTPTVLYQTNYPILVGANVLQQKGITGRGVTIAVLDTGLWQDPGQNYLFRVLASIDVVGGGSGPVTGDGYGHGTHITSIAAGGATNIYGGDLGIAPQADLVIVQAFNAEGSGRYSDVIAGLNWVVANQKKYNIRVLNLSFGATPESAYWNDPLNQAVMAAWKAGIVVVAAAGNSGPTPMTIGVPGNVPYVITAGALTDNYTPYNLSDDRLASFSSTGPTYEGFVKPEVVAPGGHMVASMQSNSYLANIDRGSMSPLENLFTMSGTSQAAAVTTGVVALMLQANPSLTPDTVKCRLLASARPAVNANGTLAYSVFQQGAGLINAVTAVSSTATGCANVGLNIAADLAGTQHFGGPANENSSGQFYIMNMAGSTWGTAQPADGYTWSSAYSSAEGYSWSEGYAWSQKYSWSQAYAWSQGYFWSKGESWSQGYFWSKSVSWWNTTGTASVATQPASIVDWVPNE